MIANRIAKRSGLAIRRL